MKRYSVVGHRGLTPLTDRLAALNQPMITRKEALARPKNWFLTYRYHISSYKYAQPLFSDCIQYLLLYLTCVFGIIYCTYLILELGYFWSSPQCQLASLKTYFRFFVYASLRRYYEHSSGFCMYGTVTRARICTMVDICIIK